MILSGWESVFFWIFSIAAILAGLLLPVLGRGKSAAKRTACLNNVHQINVAIQMYADEHEDKIGYSTNVYYAYKDCILPYVDAGPKASSNAPVFKCPADTAFHTLSLTYYSSYGLMELSVGRMSLEWRTSFLRQRARRRGRRWMGRFQVE